MGSAFKISKEGDNLAKLFRQEINTKELLGNIAVLMVGQTRDRLETTKKSPQGKSWEKWSDKYAKTRKSGHSLLRNEGHLVTSITFDVEGDELIVGSDEEYAGTHQYGNPKLNIPKREYLGISNADEVEIYQEVDDYMNKLMEV